MSAIQILLKANIGSKDIYNSLVKSGEFKKLKEEEYDELLLLIRLELCESIGEDCWLYLEDNDIFYVIEDNRFLIREATNEEIELFKLYNRIDDQRLYQMPIDQVGRIYKWEQEYIDKYMKER